MAIVIFPISGTIDLLRQPFHFRVANQAFIYHSIAVLRLKLKAAFVVVIKGQVQTNGKSVIFHLFSIMETTQGAVRKLNSRINSVDLLRGLVMVIMVLDHVRDYVHADAFRFQPTDLSKTNVMLFLTRWVTHLCAPTFVFLSGTSIYLQLMRGKSRAELAKFLLTRGLWLVFLEFTVIRFAMLFNLDYSFLGYAEVIWIFGVSMIVLAGIIFFPLRVVAVIGIAMIALHNFLDNFNIPPAISIAGTPSPDALQKLWIILHQPGIVPLFENVKVFVAYPLIPWIGVMAAGYAFGVVYTWEAESRRRFTLVLRLGLFGLFLVLRVINIYGDPQAWSVQSTAIFTVLSFLNVTKYPASLLFLLMTLGLSLMILAWANKIDETKGDNLLARILITFGRVPLFYFILQMFVAHGFAVLLNYLAGKRTNYLFLNFPNSTTDAPPDAGFNLWIVYLAWIAGLLILYPLWPVVWKNQTAAPRFSVQLSLSKFKKFGGNRETIIL